MEKTWSKLFKMAQKMQMYDETRLLKRSPLSTTAVPTEYQRNPKILCCALLTSNTTIAYHNALFVTQIFFMSIVFSFSWELKWPQEKMKTMLTQNFWGEKQRVLWYVMIFYLVVNLCHFSPRGGVWPNFAWHGDQAVVNTRATLELLDCACIPIQT